MSLIQYFNPEELNIAKAQKKKTLRLYLIVFAFFLIVSVSLWVIYFLLPYKSGKITLVKLVQYVIYAVFLVFSFVYLGIKYRRVKKYYLECVNLTTGLTESSIGTFLENNENVQDKDGVDFKSLIFIEWNKYKNDFFDRKVLVFNEKPFPVIPEKATVKYITQGNVLLSYEILGDEEYEGNSNSNR